MKKKIIASVMLAAAAVLVSTSAAWGYTGATGSNTAAPGATVTYTTPNTGEAPATPAIITVTPNVDNLAGASLITWHVAADQTVNYSFKIPATATNGEVFHTTVTAGAFTGDYAVTVVVASASGGLAFTGSTPGPYLWFGGGLLALGIALISVLTIVRRSRKATTAHV